MTTAELKKKKDDILITTTAKYKKYQTRTEIPQEKQYQINTGKNHHQAGKKKMTQKKL